VNKLVQELIRPFLGEVKSKYDLVVYGGGFKPPTSGHLSTALRAYQIPSKKHQIVVGGGVRDKITSDSSIKIWQLYQNKEGLPTNIEILQAPSPVKYTLDLAKNNPDLKIAFIAGVRDNDDLDSAEKLKKSFAPLGIQVEIIQDDSAEVSGTKVRRAFLSKDKDTFLSLMPKNSGEEVWNILTRSLIPEIQEAQSKMGYRAGLFNPSQPAERLKDKGIGIVKSKVGLLGTGYYFMGSLEDVKRLQDQLGYDTISQIDLSKYDLFRPDDPTGFYENIKAITAYLHGLKPEDLQDSDVKNNIDDAVDGFSSYLNLNKKETYNIFKDYLKDVFKRNDGDLLTNRLLKNYDGIELHFVNKNKLLNDYNGIELDDPNFWLTPYNLYCNVGLDLVKDGWIIFLDDDNYLLNETSLEEITKQLNDEDCAHIWKIEYDDLSTMPSEKSFIDKKIFLGDMDIQCITFHSKWAKYCKWDKYKCSDFRFIACLTKHIPKGEFIDKRFIKVPYAGFGKKNDI